MEQQLNELSPFLGKAETLLVLVMVLLLSVAWLLWEIFSYAQGESEEANHDWWEALKSCPHRRLIIPVRTIAGAPSCTWASARCTPDRSSSSTLTPQTLLKSQPHCVEEVPELGALSRLTTVRSKNTGVVVDMLAPVARVRCAGLDFLRRGFILRTMVCVITLTLNLPPHRPRRTRSRT